MDNDPKVGLVLWYEYVFEHEVRDGLPASSEPRRCVIINRTQERDDGSRIVYVLPISHTRPRDHEQGVRIEPEAARPLGLDTISWIKTNTANEIEWPKDARPEGVHAISNNQLGLGKLNSKSGLLAFEQFKNALRTRDFEKVKRPHEPPEKSRRQVDRAIGRVNEKPKVEPEKERPSRDEEPGR